MGLFQQPASLTSARALVRVGSSWLFATAAALTPGFPFPQP
jgi:hypothetical protein